MRGLYNLKIIAFLNRTIINQMNQQKAFFISDLKTLRLPKLKQTFNEL